MPWTYEGKLMTLENKTLRYKGHWDKMIAYRQLGLFSDDEIEFKNQKFSPRDFYHYLLEPKLAVNDSRDICIMRTEAKGLKNDIDTTVVVESIEKYDEFSQELIGSIKFTNFTTSFCMSEIKDNTELPLKYL